MSGGVGPTADVHLPKEEQEQTSATESRSKSPPSASPPRRGFFTFQNLNALAITVVFSASGLIAPADFAFVVFSILYLYFISVAAFPRLRRPPEEPVFDTKNIIFRVYVLVGAIVGLILPIAYIFEGIFEGDKEGIKAAAPHVFLLASQIFAEGLTYSRNFSIPVRVFVPVFFNARRIFSIMEWMTAEMEKAEEVHGGSWRRVYVGKALAVANMGFWSFNFLGVLLPVYLPRGFKKYYAAALEDEKHKD